MRDSDLSLIMKSVTDKSIKISGVRSLQGKIRKLTFFIFFLCWSPRVVEMVISPKLACSDMQADVVQSLQYQLLFLRVVWCIHTSCDAAHHRVKFQCIVNDK